MGDPDISWIDVLAGATLDRLCGRGDQRGKKVEVVTDEVTTNLIRGAIRIAQWKNESAERFAVIDSLTEQVKPYPWERLAPNALPLDGIKRWAPASLRA